MSPVTRAEPLRLRKEVIAVSDGREEREEEEKRREREKRKDREDWIDRDLKDQWEPERDDS